MVCHILDGLLECGQNQSQTLHLFWFSRFLKAGEQFRRLSVNFQFLDFQLHNINNKCRLVDNSLNNTDQLLLEVQNAVKSTVAGKKIGIAFSGGVDSALIAKTCKNLSYEITLLTIGFPGSHDIEFSKVVSEQLDIPHEILEIQSDSFIETAEKIKNIIKTDNLSWNENCIAFYYVAKLAKANDLTTVVTANGIDELFCGYNSYREAIEDGEDRVMDMIDEKLKNENKMMIAVNDVTAEFDVKIIQPFLSANFIDYAKKIPISEKIHGQDDMKRKHAIRALAMDYGVPEISAQKQKKALQYGTQIHKSLLKSRKTS